MRSVRNGSIMADIIAADTAITVETLLTKHPALFHPPDIAPEPRHTTQLCHTANQSVTLPPITVINNPEQTKRIAK